MIEDNVILKRFSERFPQAIVETTFFRDELTITLKKEDMVEIFRFLRDDPLLSYDFLSDLCGVDYFSEEPRFEVVYHLYSLNNKNRLRIKVKVSSADLQVPSVVSVWKTADFHERECYDLLGIEFEGHPNLKRILLWDGFEGHPLRKDYPLKGERNFSEHLKFIQGEL